MVLSNEACVEELSVFEKPSPQPLLKTESSGSGAGRRPRKTALDFGDSEDEDAKRREEERLRREHILNQRQNESSRIPYPGENLEFMKRWREKHPKPAGS